MSSIENCGGDAQVVSIDKNFTATITPDCEVVTKGCVTSKGFTKAKVNYKISKDGMVIFSGKPNFCEALDKKTEEQKARLQLFGFPTECPFPEERRCVDGDKKLNIAKFKGMLGMALGKVVVESDIEHDTVRKSAGWSPVSVYLFSIFCSCRENRASK